MIKAANEVWRKSGRKDSSVSIEESQRNGGLPVKKNLIWSLAGLVLLYLLPLVRPAAVAEALPSPLPAVLAAPSLPPLPLAEGEEAQPNSDAAPAPSLRLLRGGQVLELDAEEYLVGAVAAEMPASFPEDALRAQAVAARTYALYCRETGKHPEADLCADPACCQAWRSEEELQERWAGDYAQNLARVRAAVADTAGQVLRYEGRPILAAFHSSSAGATEDCGAVWNPRPYLVSVSSPETASDVPGYCSILRCAALDFRDVLLSACPEADFSAPPEEWIGETERDESGRVARIKLGGLPFSGTTLRQLFSLRSTAFTLRYEDGFFVFSVTGFGHGVGMSQYGAMVLAREGASWQEILAHYYPGASLGGAAA